jgi:hypothetical protein
MIPNLSTKEGFMADSFGEAMGGIAQYMDKLGEAKAQLEAARELGRATCGAFQALHEAARADSATVTYRVSPLEGNFLSIKKNTFGGQRMPSDERYRRIRHGEEPFTAVRVLAVSEAEAFGTNRNGNFTFHNPDFPPFEEMDDFVQEEVEVSLADLFVKKSVQIEFLRDGEVVGVWPPQATPAEA